MPLYGETEVSLEIVLEEEGRRKRKKKKKVNSFLPYAFQIF